MPLVALINRINMGVLLLTICTRHFPLSYEGPQKLTIGVVLWILDIYDSNLFHSNPMSFGYCSPPHLISTIPTSYLNNYLSYEQTDCFHQSYELIWTIPDTLLIYEFWRHFNHVSLATVQLNCLSSGTKEHGQNEGKIGNEESGGNRSDAFIELTNSIHLFIAQLVVEIWGRNGGNQVRRRTISKTHRIWVK